VTPPDVLQHSYSRVLASAVCGMSGNLCAGPIGSQEVLLWPAAENSGGKMLFDVAGVDGGRCCGGCILTCTHASVMNHGSVTVSVPFAHSECAAFLNAFVLIRQLWWILADLRQDSDWQDHHPRGGVLGHDRHGQVQDPGQGGVLFHHAAQLLSLLPRR